MKLEVHIHVHGDPVVAAELRQLNHKVHTLIMAEQDLANALVAQAQTIKDAVAQAAQRILDRITEAAAGSDVSPTLQAAIDAGQADIDAINALAQPTPPVTPP